MKLSESEQKLYNKAFKLYQKASAIDEVHLDWAYDLYIRAIKIYPNLDIAYTNIGCMFYKKDLKIAGLEYFKKALAINPNQPEALYNIGNYYQDNFRIKSAIKFYLKALKNNSEFGDCIYSLALCYHYNNDINLSIKYLKRYLNLKLSNQNSKFVSIAEYNLNLLMKKN